VNSHKKDILKSCRIMPDYQLAVVHDRDMCKDQNMCQHHYQFPVLVQSIKTSSSVIGTAKEPHESTLNVIRWCLKIYLDSMYAKDKIFPQKVDFLQPLNKLW
jgi:hypothetical protein